MSQDIEQFIIEKILKFKNEYFNYFDQSQKYKFMELLLKMNNFSEKVNVDYYFEVMDYQLMDYEYFGIYKSEIMIRSEYPNIFNLYVDNLDLKIDKEYDLEANINSFIMNLIHDNNKIAGFFFEKAVTNYFKFKKGKNRISEAENKEFPSILKSPKFDIYGKFFLFDALNFDIISKEELLLDSLSPIEKLNDIQLLMKEGKLLQDFLYKISSNCMFYNKSSNSPLIDGGFIYRFGPNKLHYKIITYKTIVGEKNFSQYLDSLKVEDLNKIDDNYFINNETFNIDREAQGLEKLIKELEQTVPMRITNFMKNDERINFMIPDIKIELEKHIYIYPKLEGN